MSGDRESGSPPPEVPEEFAAAYRAAFEEALRAERSEAQVTGRPSRRAPREVQSTNVMTKLRGALWTAPVAVGVLATLLLVLALVVFLAAQD